MQKRYSIVFLLFLFTAYINVTKFNLTYTMKILVKREPVNISKEELCPNIKNVTEEKQEIVQKKYEWTEDTVTNTNTLQYAGFAVSHLIGGYISDKYGAKHIISISVTSLSLLTTFWPVFITGSDGNPIVLYILSLTTGLCNGCLYPATYAALAHWVPYREWGRLCTFTFTGLPFGTMIVKLFSFRLVAKTSDWRTTFYVYGGVGLGLSLIWLLIGSSNPRNYSSMDSDEDLYLTTQLGDTVDHDTKEVPLKRIFTSKEVWALTLGTFGHMWYLTVIGFFLNGFLKDISGVDQDENVVWGPLSSLARMLAGIASGIFTDYAVSRNLVDAVFLRHIFTNIGLMGPAIYLTAMSFAQCRKTLGQVLLYSSMISGGPLFAGIRLIPLDLSPNYSGMIAAITHGVGIATGPLISVVQKSGGDKVLADYRVIYFETLAMAAISNLFYVLFARIRLQDWNTPPSRSMRKSQ